MIGLNGFFYLEVLFLTSKKHWGCTLQDIQGERMLLRIVAFCKYLSVHSEERRRKGSSFSALAGRQGNVEQVSVPRHLLLWTVRTEMGTIICEKHANNRKLSLWRSIQDCLFKRLGSHSSLRRVCRSSGEADVSLCERCCWCIFSPCPQGDYSS